MIAIFEITGGFFQGFFERLHHPCMSRRRCIKKDIELREHLSERQIDKMIADSFPASDPPSTY